MSSVTLNANLHRRSEASGRAFSITFAVIALLVILACVFWGFILPKLHGRSSCPRSGRTRTSQSDDGDYHDEPRLSPHPALYDGFYHNPTPTVRHYNPRTESPFPQHAYSLTNLPLRSTFSASAPVISSQGLFSPAKNVQSSVRLGRHPKATIWPPGAARQSSDMDVRRYNDERDYILPVPEPLVLKPRPAGRPPPLTRQLERFPMPVGTQRRRNDHVHPLKIFQEIERRSSGSTTKSFDTPCPTHSSVQGIRSSKTPTRVPSERHSNLLVAASGSSYALPQRVSYSKNFVKTPKRALSMPIGSTTQESILRCLRHPTGLDRAGTVTRPKTPVAELRDLFDKSSSATQTEATKDQNTPLNLFTTSISLSTPPTTPLFSINTTSVPAFCSPHNVEPQGRNSSTDTRNLSIELVPAQKHLTKGKDSLRRKSYLPEIGGRKRPRPANLSLSLLSSLPGCKDRVRRRSMSSLSTILKPIMPTPISSRSARASSIYSRDTKGVSVLGSPSNDRLQFRGNGPVSGEPKIVFMDMVKSKIDNWDLHTGDITSSDIKYTTTKQRSSDVGLRSPFLPQISNDKLTQSPQLNRTMLNKIVEPHVPEIRIGSGSIDILGQRFPDAQEQHNGFKVGTQSSRAGLEKCTSTKMNLAPGGVGWI